MISIYIYILHIHTVQCTSFVFSIYELLLIVTLFPNKGNSKKIETLAVFLVSCLMDAP